MAGYNPTNIAPHIGTIFFVGRNPRERYEIPGDGTAEAYTDMSMDNHAKPNWALSEKARIVCIAGIRTPWLASRQARKELGYRIEKEASMDGSWAYDKKAYEQRRAEVLRNLSDFLAREGRSPQKGDFLIIGIERDFSYYNDMIKDSEKPKIWTGITPAFISHPVTEIKSPEGK